MERFFTTEQVANILQVHPFTILKFIKDGRLRGVKLGRVYRIKESDVQEFLEMRTIGSKKASNNNVSREKETSDTSQNADSESEEPEKLEKDNYEIKKDDEENKDHFYII